MDRDWEFLGSSPVQTYVSNKNYTLCTYPFEKQAQLYFQESFQFFFVTNLHIFAFAYVPRRNVSKTVSDYFCLSLFKFQYFSSY